MKQELELLPNIGKETASQLRQAGIETYEQLKEAGSRGAWLRIQAFDPSACYNRLCALDGAIRGVRWHDLTDDVKRELKAFYQAHRMS